MGIDIDDLLRERLGVVGQAFDAGPADVVGSGAFYESCSRHHRQESLAPIAAEVCPDCLGSGHQLSMELVDRGGSGFGCGRAFGQAVALLGSG